MVEIAVKFKWSYVSLVYSADEYGELGNHPKHLIIWVFE